MQVNQFSLTSLKVKIMSTFKIQYQKAHNAQAKHLTECGIQLDVDGYPLCSDSWLEKVLTPKQLREYDHFESIKDELNRKERICNYKSS